MASNHTTNIHLSQWEENDEVLRTDFNADNLKLDAALSAAEQNLQTAQAQSAAAIQAAESKITAETARALAAEGKLRCACGFYTGDGASEGKAIDLGFAPAAVFGVYLGNRFVITGSVGSTNTSALSVRGGPTSSITLTDTGFRVKGYLNTEGSVHTYVAWQ